MVILHAGLVLRRLRELGASGEAIAQDLVDRVFAQVRRRLARDVDQRRRRRQANQAMAEAFFGRNKAYDDALASRDGDALAAALARNVYRREDCAGPEVPRARRTRSRLGRGARTGPVGGVRGGPFPISQSCRESRRDRRGSVQPPRQSRRPAARRAGPDHRSDAGRARRLARQNGLVDVAKLDARFRFAARRPRGRASEARCMPKSRRPASSRWSRSQ